jgi:uncharacterized protein (TIGR02466 family)
MHVFRPFGPTIGKFKLEHSMVIKLNNYVDEKLNANKLQSWGDHLAGQIKNEFVLPFEELNKLTGVADFVAAHVRQYVKESTGYEISKCIFRSIWVNQQFKNEYNPTHWHDGHISGVLYLNIPEDLSQGAIKKGRDTDGKIIFTHGVRQFTSYSIHPEMPEVGTVLIFPHYLMHHVYPFNVEGERRSIAFNIDIDDHIFNVY